MSILSRTKKLLGQEEAKKSDSKKKNAETPAKNSDAPKTEELQAGSVMAKKIDLRVVISEKSMASQFNDSVMTFRVRPEATKGQIREAIVERYGVTPQSIRTVSGKPKARRRGATVGRTTAWKKAYAKVEDVSAFNVAP